MRQKTAAEKATRRVAGVRALTEQIKVRNPTGVNYTDPDLAKRILASFAWNVTIPDDEIKVKVENGLVTLSGTVDLYYQANAACKAAGRIKGVTGIVNRIEVRKIPTPTNVQERIMQAFARSAELDAAAVTVSTTDDGMVTLGGKVKTWHERKAAEHAAWAAPGVMEVDNQIVVG